jgi:hypothetical protein
MQEDRDEGQMLDDIGKISRVKGMSIIHAATIARAGEQGNRHGLIRRDGRATRLLP